MLRAFLGPSNGACICKKWDLGNDSDAQRQFWCSESEAARVLLSYSTLHDVKLCDLTTSRSEEIKSTAADKYCRCVVNPSSYCFSSCMLSSKHSLFEQDPAGFVLPSDGVGFRTHLVPLPAPNVRLQIFGTLGIFVLGIFGILMDSRLQFQCEIDPSGFVLCDVTVALMMCMTESYW
jgi:hypothetical protein